MKRETHERLVNWAYWYRSHYLPSEFWVGCESAEQGYTGPMGDQYLSSSERLQNALKSGVAALSREDADRVADRMRPPFPERYRLVLKLHYIAFKTIPRKQKLRILGVNYDGYFQLLDDAAAAIERTTAA